MCARSRRHRRPPRRDHRSGRPEDDHQRAQLRARACSWPTSRTRTRRSGTTTSRATSTCATRFAGGSTSSSPEGKPYRLNDKTASAVRPSARLAPAGEARADRRHSRSRAASSISRSTSSTTRRSSSRAAPARTSTCRSSRAIWRRGCGTTSSSWPQRELGVPRGDDQGDGADRDAARRVRDGRDPLRAARALGGAQLRPLGLHLLVHQEVPQPSGLLPRRPRAGHDDDAFHEELRAAARSRRAIGATSTRWAGWPRRSRSRTTRPPTPRRSPR